MELWLTKTTKTVELAVGDRVVPAMVFEGESDGQSVYALVLRVGVLGDGDALPEDPGVAPSAEADALAARNTLAFSPLVEE